MPSTNPVIFVVDDDRFILSYTRVVLGKWSEVHLFESAKAALDEMNSKDLVPDILILDLNMPDIDGIQFVVELQDRRFNGSVILISGANQRLLETSTAIVVRHGIPMLGWLSKPIAADKLTAMVDQWLPPVAKRERSERKNYQAHELSEAVTERQLFNTYQPKVDMNTGAVTGFEALVRWQHPQDGIVGPDQFIPAAEDSELIGSVTALVLDNALSDLRAFRRELGDVTMAVNLSMKNLEESDLPEKVSRLAETYSIKPDSLTLEVTESAIVEQHSLAIDTITRLRLRGFHVSIDDFGTGHSSMEKLRDIAFSQLKIDRGFVTSAAQDSAKNSIFLSSLHLAQYLEMSTVAEGIETEDDWAYVKEAGCDSGQGYFISKPLFAADVLDWVGQWSEAHDCTILSGSAVSLSG